VDRLKQAGYTIKDACKALGYSRSGYYASKRAREEVGERSADRDAELVARIEAIKAEHPFWGYRRVRAWLVQRENIHVNEKRVRQIMKEYGLMATQTVHKAKRRPQCPDKWVAVQCVVLLILNCIVI